MLRASGLEPRFSSLRAARPLMIVAALSGVLALAGCEENGRLPSNSRHYVPISPQMQALMSQKGMNARSPILIRTYKKESELEVWKQDASGQYALLKTFPMCRWSGQLGPKKVEGDRQVPEGFYAITQNQLNPNSSYYLSFNVGYPNAFDRAHGRNGTNIMVHGACSSRGCFSMTDEQIADIYALTREAFGGGQKAVQMQSFPFRMSAENLAKFRADENMPFWKNLKEGADHFDVTKREVQVSVCNRRYVFNAQGKDGASLEAGASCPPLQRDEALEAQVAQKARADEQQVASLVQSGVKAVKQVYHDGDQHPAYRHSPYASAGSDSTIVAVAAPRSGAPREPELISRPEAIDFGAVEVPHDQARGLNRQALLAKATQIKAQQQLASAPQPAAPAPAAASAPKANGAAPKAVAAAPNPVAPTALVAGDVKKEEPAFYQKLFGSLSTLTANSKGAEEIQPQPVQAPVPPRAPPRR
ncbi:MAG: murein L,D-transpeptidase [Proteobacteria bacterium]|nr:murein L,D-transpeptidase [Pseudomonadota bacterium]